MTVFLVSPSMGTRTSMVPVAPVDGQEATVRPSDARMLSNTGGICRGMARQRQCELVVGVISSHGWSR